MKLFISGTDTGVGKTLVSSALVHGLLQANPQQKTRYWKPVQTGSQELDSHTVGEVHPQVVIEPTRFSYPTPCSPDQASRIDLRDPVNFKDLNDAFRQLAQCGSTLVVEGAGGLMVPLNDSCVTWLDWLSQIQLPVILVARTGLGTLNHTSLSLKALANRGIDVLGVVLNGSKHEENQKSLMAMFPNIVFSWFPLMESVSPDNPKWAQASLTLAHEVLQMWASRQERQTTMSQVVRALDHKFVWHPFTQHREAPEPIGIARAQGVYLWDYQGRQYLDATASWWTNTIGHGRIEVGEAIANQQQALDHVIFAGTYHAQAAKLSSRLIDRSSGAFSKVFFSDNGSTSVEIALKMAIQWQYQRDQKKSRILTLKGGYHGDTFGAMSLSGNQTFYKPFNDFLFKVDNFEPCLINTPEENIKSNLDHLRTYLDQHQSELAAVVLEPMVQGAGGMMIQDPIWLTSVCAMFNHYQIPLIFDEVFVGMGRLGHMFAFQRLDLKPDIICLAKGLTGGTMPLAVTLVTQSIFDGFYWEDRSKAFFHGHSFTGNPIACAAANASLDIYENEDLCQRAYAIESTFGKWISHQAAGLNLTNPRALGAILAFELSASTKHDYLSSNSYQIMQCGIRHGILLRPLGNTLYLVPPLSISDGELERGLDLLTKVVKDLS